MTSKSSDELALTIIDQASNILPLDELFIRLTNVGFELSPADRLRAYRLLRSRAATEWLSAGGLEKFGLLLAPVLCRSEAEQETFQRVYAGYLAELKDGTDAIITSTAPAAAPQWYDRYLEEKWVMGLLGLTIIGMLAWYLIGRGDDVATPDLVAQIEGPFSITEGDTLLLGNHSLLPTGIDSSEVSFSWTIYNSETYQELSSSKEGWSYKQPAAAVTPANQYRRALLEIIDPKTGLVSVAEHNFRVKCADNPPLRAVVVNTVTLPSGAAQPRFQASFDTSLLAKTGLTPDDFEYRWVVDSATAGGETNSVLNYVLFDGRTYHVRLTSFTPQEGEFCSTSVELNYTHGAPKVTLPLYPYAPVDYPLISGFRSWWIFTILPLLFFFILGARRMWLDEIKALKNAEKLRRKAAEKPRIPPAPDAPPYGIPWVSQEALLPLEQSHLKLARAMRHRAGDGGRKELNALKTLRATVRSGGFPTPKFTFRKRSGEYVMLIDEVDAQSHQGRLFKRLAAELNRRDVYAEVYFYQRQLNRVWNARDAHGVSLDEVARRHGGQRLLILGDAHELLDKRNDGRPELAPKALSWLAAFPERLLLTPAPPAAWGYEEKTLYRHFPVFPADTTGIVHAANYLQTYGEREKPDFDALRADLRQQRPQERDPRHRRWRRATEIREHFAGRPDLFAWAGALAIHPAPNFDLTVAIGRALEPFGVTVNHDNLLALSRWPALNEGHLRRRLRDDLLGTLPREVILAARSALATELKKAKPATVGGSAARELAGILAVQTFTLDKEDDNAKAAVGELLQAGALNGDLLKDLQREVSLGDEPVVEAPAPKAPPAERPVDGPPGYAEIHNLWQAAQQAEDVALMRQWVPVAKRRFPDFQRQLENIENNLNVESGIAREKAQLLGAKPEHRTKDLVQQLLSYIRNSQDKWVSEEDLSGTYTATQTVERMIQTDRLSAAVQYLTKLVGQDLPEKKKELDSLHKILTTYSDEAAGPTKKKSMFQQKAPAETSPMAREGLINSITLLAGELDRVRISRTTAEMTTKARQNIAALRETTSKVTTLEEYFTSATGLQDKDEAPIVVARPAWWPALVAASALGLLLAFLFLYPKHHTNKLYAWAGEDGTNWFVKAIEPEDLAVIYHQRGVDLIKEYNLTGLEGISNAINEREGDYPSAEINLATGIYNYYTRLHNDTSLVAAKGGDPAYVFLADAINDMRLDFSVNAYEKNIPARANLDHLQAVLMQQFEPEYRSRFEGAINEYYQSLLNKGYFDTLSYSPNLQTMLTGAIMPDPETEEPPTPTTGNQEPQPEPDNLEQDQPITVYTPENTPYKEYRIQIRDEQTDQPIPQAKVSVFFNGEAFGGNYYADAEGLVIIKLPTANDGNRQLLISAPDYQFKRFDEAELRPRLPRDSWSLQLTPEEMTKVDIPNLILILPPGADQESVNYGLNDLASILNRGKSYFESNISFNPRNDDITALTNVIARQVEQLLSAKDALTNACAAPTPVKINIKAYQPVDEDVGKGPGGIPNYAAFISRAFRADPDLRSCIADKTISITTELEEVEWPVSSAGEIMSKDHWRVRRAAQVVISFE